MTPALKKLEASHVDRWTRIAFKAAGMNERNALINWLDGFAEGSSLICTNDVRFENDQDAVMFRLRYVK